MQGLLHTFIHGSSDPKSELVTLSKIASTILATLIPAAVTAVVTWTQEHSTTRRRLDISQRMLSLAKSISEFPEIPPHTAAAHDPRAVLSDELNLLSEELKTLQAKSVKRPAAYTTVPDRLRQAFLIYRPYGPLAWILHIIFYIYAPVLVLIGLFVMLDIHDPDFRFIFLAYVILGVPPVVVRYFAARLHRKHCQPVSQKPPVALKASA